MKLVDFDKKFFEYAKKWMIAHPGLSEDKIEESYNRIMEEMLAWPDPELDGKTIPQYFDQLTDTSEMIDMMQDYHAARINLPEYLYSKIIEKGSEAAAYLREILSDESRSEAIRAESMTMLNDIGDRETIDILMDLVLNAEERNELSDLAADILSEQTFEVAGRLMDHYLEASEYAQTLILEIASNFPGDDRVTDELIYRLKNRPEARALNAALLKKIGDDRALPALQEMLGLFELRYYDYLEICDAIEALGGEPDRERTFYGDPDYEALRFTD